MAEEEREATYGAEVPGDEPVFPHAPATGPGDWNDLGSAPQWPQTWPAADSDPTASMRSPTASFSSGEVAAGVAQWGVHPGVASVVPVASPDDTWQDNSQRDDTWRDDTVARRHRAQRHRARQ